MPRPKDDATARDGSRNPDPVHDAIISARLQALQDGVGRQPESQPGRAAAAIHDGVRHSRLRRMRAGLGQSLMALGERIEGSTDCGDCPAPNPA